MPKLVMSRQTKAERKTERGKVGTLQSQIVTENTADRYAQSFHSFLNFVGKTRQQVENSVSQIDRWLSEYVEFLWKDGEPKSYANYAVASVQHYVPEARRRLGISWKLVSTWNRIEMPSRALPITADLILSFAGQLLKWGWKDLSYVILVGFSCFLRTGEMFRLRRQDVHLPVRAGQAAIVFLEDTKGGQRKQMAWEKVLVKESLALSCLRALCFRRNGPDLLVQTSIYQFRKVWKDVVAHFNLGHLAIQPYSIRRGGATSSYKNGTSFEELLTQGRWSNFATCRIYLDEALQELGTLSIPPSSSHALLLAKQHFYSCKPGRGA